MPPEVFLIALLSTVGIAAITVIKVARLLTTRRDSVPTDVAERLEELERAVQTVQTQLAETHERLDFTERLLSTARKDRQIGG
jgi:chaperonin cofactor prefoldin